MSIVYSLNLSACTGRSTYSTDGQLQADGWDVDIDKQMDRQTDRRGIDGVRPYTYVHACTRAHPIQHTHTAQTAAHARFRDILYRFCLTVGNWLKTLSSCSAFVMARNKPKAGEEQESAFSVTFSSFEDNPEPGGPFDGFGHSFNNFPPANKETVWKLVYTVLPSNCQRFRTWSFSAVKMQHHRRRKQNHQVCNTNLWLQWFATVRLIVNVSRAAGRSWDGERAKIRIGGSHSRCV